MEKFFENLRKEIPTIAKQASDKIMNELKVEREDKSEVFVMLATNEFNFLPQEEKSLWNEGEYLIMRTCIETRSINEINLLKVLLEKNIEKSPKLKTVLDVINNDKRLELVNHEYYRFMLEKLL